MTTHLLSRRISNTTNRKHESRVILVSCPYIATIFIYRIGRPCLNEIFIQTRLYILFFKLLVYIYIYIYIYIFKISLIFKTQTDMSRIVRSQVLYIERASLEEATHEKLKLKYSRDKTCISVLQNFRFFFRPPLTFMKFCRNFESW
jgi:hypothetical protein